MTSKVFSYFAVAVLTGLASISGSIAQNTPEKTNSRSESVAKAPTVTVAEAKKITFVDSILVTGSLVAREEVLVGPEIDGYRITDILVEEGDHVVARQTLAKLARDTLEAQISQNVASVSKTQAAVDQVRNQLVESDATLRQAEDAFNRVKPLRETGVASQASFDDRELSFRSARARLAAQKEGLRLAEADHQLMLAQRQEMDVKINHTFIKTPAAGTVSRRTARIGAISATGGDPLFRIIKDGEIELDAEIPEFYMYKVKAGQAVDIEIAGDEHKRGAVRLVSSEVSPTSRLGRVRIFLGNSPDLRIGTFAKGIIDAGQRDSIGVASTSILYRNDVANVLVVQNGHVHERQVRVGVLAGDNVEIRDGLKEGEVVILRAGSLLREGDAVTPQFLPKETAGTTPEKSVR